MKYLLTFVRDQDQMYEANEEEMRKGMEAGTHSTARRSTPAC